MLASDSRCFYLDRADGSRYALVFTRHVAEAIGASLVYRGTTYRPGDRLEVFGGTTAQTTERGPLVSVDISSCDPEADPWFVS